MLLKIMRKTRFNIRKTRKLGKIYKNKGNSFNAKCWTCRSKSAANPLKSTYDYTSAIDRGKFVSKSFVLSPDRRYASGANSVNASMAAAPPPPTGALRFDSSRGTSAPSGALQQVNMRRSVEPQIQMCQTSNVATTPENVGGSRYFNSPESWFQTSRSSSQNLSFQPASIGGIANTLTTALKKRKIAAPVSRSHKQVEKPETSNQAGFDEESDDECGLLWDTEEGAADTSTQGKSSNIVQMITLNDRLHYLIDKQQFSGEYQLTKELVKCVLLCFGSKDQSGAVLDQFKAVATNLRVVEDLVATVFVMVTFEKSELKSEEDTWELIVEKAVDWSNATGDVEKVRKEVMRVLQL